MIAVILTETQHDYLTYVFQKYIESGVSTNELAAAAQTWDALNKAQKFELPPQGEKEVKTIDGPVALVVNGDMTLPVDVQEQK